MGSTLLRNIQQLWARWSMRKRGAAIAGVLVTLTALAFASRVLATPDYKPLMVGLEPADVQATSAHFQPRRSLFRSHLTEKASMYRLIS